jgi:signal transduction histidine kinase
MKSRSSRVAPERRQTRGGTRLAAERQRADEAEQLNSILLGVVDASRLLIETDTFESALHGWLNAVAVTVGADYAKIGRFVDAEEAVALVDWAWRRPGCAPLRPVPIPRTRDFEAWRERLLRGEVIIGQRDELSDPASVRFWKTIGCFSDAIVPIVSGRQTIGWVSFNWASRRTITSGHVAVLRTAANGVASALKRHEARSALQAERERAVQARAAELQRANRALGRATAGLVAESDASRFLCSLMAETSAMTKAKTAGIFTYDEATERLRMFALMTDGRDVDLLSDPRMVVWREDVPLVISRRWIEQLRTRDFATFDNHTQIENHPWPISREWHIRRGHRHVITVPLYAGRRLIGTFGQCFPDGYDVAGFDFDMTRVLANHAALALHLMQLSRAARQSATAAAILGERNRIARDLHDTLAQGFAGVIAQLGAAEGPLELGQVAGARAYLDRAKLLARFSLSEARASVHALRPAVALEPLRDRIERMIHDMTHGLSLVCQLRESGAPGVLSPALDWCAYKFVQEALANAMKHSGASRLELELLWTENLLELRAADNGRGLPENFSNGLGFVSMAERAAEASGVFRYESRPSGGLALSFQLPRNPPVRRSESSGT